MRVLSALTGTTAGKMFGGQRHRGGGEFCALETQHHLGHHLRHPFGVLAEGSLNTLPAGFSGEIGHIHIAFSEANCQPFLARNVCKLTYQREVIHRRKSQFAGPGGERGYTYAEANGCVFGDVVPGVGGNDRWDTEPIAFTCCL